MRRQDRDSQGSGRTRAKNVTQFSRLGGPWGTGDRTGEWHTMYGWSDRSDSRDSNIIGRGRDFNDGHRMDVTSALSLYQIFCGRAWLKFSGRDGTVCIAARVYEWRVYACLLKSCTTAALPLHYRLHYRCTTAALPLLHYRCTTGCTTAALPAALPLLHYRCCTTAALPLHYRCCTTAALPLLHYRCTTAALPAALPLHYRLHYRCTTGCTTAALPLHYRCCTTAALPLHYLLHYRCTTRCTTAALPLHYVCVHMPQHH